MDLLYNAYIKIQPVGKEVEVLLENDEYTFLKGFAEVRIIFIIIIFILRIISFILYM